MRLPTHARSLCSIPHSSNLHPCGVAALFSTLVNSDATYSWSPLVLPETDRARIPLGSPRARVAGYSRPLHTCIGGRRDSQPAQDMLVNAPK
ncbi:hypothetical protein NDU88_001465 [Pleurodeles waltl]|uniref:Uncharacterized protein n=1 Tax=Pleurodeles waltl TaxID=8319 RepID=A0AAV7MMR9_PLEWA|nr:hypothetical protein NDU88_001465 [Pleurodeles waltl]